MSIDLIKSHCIERPVLKKCGGAINIWLPVFLYHLLFSAHDTRVKNDDNIIIFG